MYDNREYCPVAKASQLLCERWTVLIVRELLNGISRFNQLRRCLPRISPSLLRTRLRTLEAEGIVARVKIHASGSYEYQLTPAGCDLGSVVLAMGNWATRWQYEKFMHEEVHVEALMRDLEMTLIPAEMPGPRSVLRFLFSDLDVANRWYVVIENGHAEACDDDRGLEVDVYLSGERKTVADILIGKVALHAAMTNGHLKVTGSKAHISRIRNWFGLAPFTVTRSESHGLGAR